MSDAFDRLWTPYRMAYIQGENKPSSDEAGEACPFCRAPGLPVDEGLVVARGQHAYVVLNRYPYNAGHVLVCPYRHTADYIDLTAEEVSEFTELTRRAIAVINTVSAPQGFNIGMNQGRLAGAGIAAHLHQHIVPRWGGDTNFMPVVGNTRVLPELLERTRELLAEAWATD